MGRPDLVVQSGLRAHSGGIVRRVGRRGTACDGSGAKDALGDALAIARWCHDVSVSRILAGGRVGSDHTIEIRQYIARCLTE